MSSAITHEERRHNPRTKLHHIAYMSIGSGNGAIVLDVSQGGLAFHAAAPLESEGPVRFRVLGKSIDRVEVIGELAWNDQSKKSGGVRFTSLPDEFRERILLSLGHPPFSAGNSPRVEIRKGATNDSDSGPSILPKVISRTGNGATATGREQSVSAPKIPRPSVGLGFRFLGSVVLAAIVLNCLTVLFIRRLARDRTHEAVLTETLNSLLASRTAFHQTEAALRHKADLLSTLAAVTPSGDSTLQASLDDPLITDGSDLIVMTDGTNRITAFHTRDRSMTVTTAEEMLVQSLTRGDISDWWFTNGKLYQVVLQSQDHRPLANNSSGAVIVGRQVDYDAVQYLKAIAASEVAFFYGGEVVESTLNRFDQYELSQKLHSQLDSEQLQIGGQNSYASSINLANGSGSVLRYTVLKSDEEATAFLNRLNHLFLRLGEIELIVLLVLIIVVFSEHIRARAANVRSKASEVSHQPV
jgi:uncharacterized membrane protein